ncbi:hypothetical protein C7B06_25485 [Escherichia coli]|nr:hypothetical protein C7B06_25485 [Escherichia coli]PSZ11033.1 hypothetical protein C7B07_25505 [Escherichia coli]
MTLIKNHFLSAWQEIFNLYRQGANYENQSPLPKHLVCIVINYSRILSQKEFSVGLRLWLIRRIWRQYNIAKRVMNR